MTPSTHLRYAGVKDLAHPGRPGLLWIGNQVSGTRGTKGVSEHIIELLRARGWGIYAASRHENRCARLSDMLICAFSHRREYALGVVDVYSGLAFRYAEILSAFLCWMGKPVVLVLHGGGLVEFARIHPERLCRFLRRGHTVVTPSRYLRSGLSGLRSDIEYLPNGVDCNHFAFTPRNRFGPQLCWVRAFNRIYNPLMAVKCLAYLRSDFPEAHLFMAGPDRNDGSMASVLKHARELGIGRALEVVGSLPNDKIPCLLGKGDIFLNTTNHESFGVSVMEAAACGLCIVTTNVGELSHLWKHGQDAILVQPDDAIGMAKAVRQLLEQPDLATDLSRNARRKAEQFDWSVVLPLWEKLLSRVADGLRTTVDATGRLTGTQIGCEP